MIVYQLILQTGGSSRDAQSYKDKYSGLPEHDRSQIMESLAKDIVAGKQAGTIVQDLENNINARKP